MKILTRDKIDSKYKWDLDSFKNILDNRSNSLDELDRLVNEIINYKGKILDNDNLLKVLELNEKIDRIISNYYVYSNMKYNEDTSNSNDQEYKNKIEKIYTGICEKLSFISPEILSCDYNSIKEKIAKSKNLQKYDFKLEKMFRYKKHTLNENEEKLLSSLNEILASSSKIYHSLTETDMIFDDIVDEDGKKQEYNEVVYGKYIKSNNRNVRKSAFENLYKEYKKYKNTIFGTFITNIKAETTIARIKGYDSALESSLYKDNIDVKIYNNLIEVVNDNLDKLQEYLEIKKNLLNIKEMHMYDLYAPIVKQIDKDYSFNECKKIVLDALKVLGNDYISIASSAFSDGWIDIYPNKYKRGGAYSWGTYDSKPFMMLNYTENLNSVSTTAHELGHSMHSYLSTKNQEYLYSSYPIVLAEIASTVNEILVSNYLLNNSKDKNERIYVLNNLLELFRTTIYRQTMFAEFEKIIHEKEENNVTLTEENVSNIYYDLNKKYFGNNIFVDDDIKYEWERIPHFYTNFYVYKYATGLSVASAIASDILNNKDGVRERYINFLSSGGRNYPLNLLKECGYDLNDKKTIQKALDLFKKYINMLKEELK